MSKLKLSEILDDKPVKVTVELPGTPQRDLVAYSEILSRENNQSPTEPSRLMVPMLERFIATDRGICEGSARNASTSCGSAVAWFASEEGISAP